MLKATHLILFLSLVFGIFIISGGQKTDGKNKANPNSLAKTEKILPPNPTTLDETTITIAAGGDIMLGSAFPNLGRMPPNDGKDLLNPVAPIFQSADIGFGNLEGPLADGGVSPKCKKETKLERELETKTRSETDLKEIEEKKKVKTNCYAFRMPTHYANYLKEAGFDIMSVANNHAGDFGNSGRLSTRQTLDKLGIKHAGSDKGKYSTTYLDVKGKKIAFIGFATNTISLNVNYLTEAKTAVRKADKIADIVVVSFHAGAEGSNAQRVPKQTEIFFGEKRGNLPLFSKAVIDAGADLVIGHGPHVLRGMEIYKDRLVAYSLGNFATYGRFTLKGATAETLVLEVEIDGEGKFVKGKIHPFILKSWGFLTPDKTNSATKTIRRLSLLDFPQSAPNIDDDGIITLN